ncbi:MAG TPA: hypothetical protein PLQ06_07370 [Bacteroidales bacterium]|nr:hypothetical protein [Bacteroidales bacterium]
MILVITFLSVATRSAARSAICISLVLIATSGILITLKLFLLAVIYLFICAGGTILFLRKSGVFEKKPPDENKKLTWPRQSAAIITAVAFLAISIITMLRFRFAPYQNTDGEVHLPENLNNSLTAITDGIILPALIIVLLFTTAAVVISSVLRDSYNKDMKKNKNK